MAKRSKLPTSLAELTLGKILAYILVAYAIVMLVRAVWQAFNDESFDIASVATPAPSKPTPLCQHNTSFPCHYKEARGENVQCNYEWNAPAVFKKDVRLHGTTANDAMKRLQFCKVTDTGSENIMASSCDNTMQSVWHNYTAGLNRSEQALSAQVSTLQTNVEQSASDQRASQKAMNSARSAMNSASQTASQSNSTLTTIANQLKAQKRCDVDLGKTKTKLTNTQNTLQQKTRELSSANARIQQLVDTQGQMQTIIDDYKNASDSGVLGNTSSANNASPDALTTDTATDTATDATQPTQSTLSTPSPGAGVM